MQIIKPDLSTRRLFDRYEKAGGVLEFVMIDVRSSQLASEDLHKKAATIAYSFVQRIHHEKLEGTVGEDRFCGLLITFDDFFGPLFDHERRCLLLKNALSEREMRGFAYAFSQPPYRLRAAEELFLGFYRSIFFGFPAGTEFWQWNTDALRYFDAGREWWGTFFWTVRPLSIGQIIAILGSSTD